MLQCDKCDGACCRMVTIKVGAMSEDQARWAAMRGEVKGEHWVLPVRCVALNNFTGKCTIYEDRPDVCREFEMGGTLCKAAIKTAKGK